MAFVRIKSYPNKRELLIAIKQFLHRINGKESSLGEAYALINRQVLFEDLDSYQLRTLYDCTKDVAILETCPTVVDPWVVLDDHSSQTEWEVEQTRFYEAQRIHDEKIGEAREWYNTLDAETQAKIDLLCQGMMPRA